MHSEPMKIPRVCFRITAYHSVVASPVPWILNQGRCSAASGSTMPASTSCLNVAT